MSFIVALGAPQVRPPIIALAALSASSIQVSISAAGSSTNGVKGYQISWSLNAPGGAQFSAQVPLAAFPYTITGLSASTTYLVLAQTIDAGPNGGLSTAAFGTATTSAGVPGQVVGLTATPVSTTQINLSWNAVAGASSYKVFKNSVAVGTPATTSYMATGLTASTQYAFNVEAVNAIGAGPQSATVNATTQSGGGSTLIGFRTTLGREDSNQMVGYGNGWNNRSGGQASPDLDSSLADTNVGVFAAELNWGCIENAQGQYITASNSPNNVIEFFANKARGSHLKIHFWCHGEAVPNVTSGSAAVSGGYLPSYLNDGGATFGLQVGAFGFEGSPALVVPYLGKPAVINAFVSMISALLNYVTIGDGLPVWKCPWFHGITVYETAYAPAAGIPFDSSWGTNSQNWINNYTNLIIPNLRAAFPSVLFHTRANYSGGPGPSQLVPLFQACLANLWAIGGGTDWTQSTDADQVINGSVGGVDYRTKLPMFLFNEDSGNTGQTIGDSHNGGAPWSANSTAAAMIACCQDPNAFNCAIDFPLRFSNDGWNNSTFAQITAAYGAAGAHMAITTAPAGFTLV